MAGKGDKRREMQITIKEYDARYNKIFGKKDIEKTDENIEIDEDRSGLPFRDYTSRTEKQ